MSQPVLEIEGLWIRYGETAAVAGVDLKLEERGLLALVGPSGCGKTSLLRAIAGFEPPAAGRISIDGRRVAGDGAWVPPEKRRVGMVFQQGALFPHMTVGANVLYGVGRAGRRRALEVLELVGLEGLSERYPDELSGGQQQRVALARALAPGPEMVLLDEPFANLDAVLRQRLREEVRIILEAAGATAILVTHDQEEALSIAEQVAVMADGRILQQGAPENVYHEPVSPEVAQLLGDARLVACVIEGGMASSRFGTAVVEAADGPGRLLVRPEDWLIEPADYPDGVLGTVLRCRFYGHDLLADVRIEQESGRSPGPPGLPTAGSEAGAIVQVRQVSSRRPRTGSRVRLRLRDKRFRIFPASAG